MADTWLGDKAWDGDADDVMVGLYIVVEDDNSYITPGAPKTGDSTMKGMYIGLLCVSGLVAISCLSAEGGRKHARSKADGADM